MKAKMLVCGFLYLLGVSQVSSASQLDFTWNAPKTYVHNKGTGGEVRYIIWFYNLGNTIDQPILVPIEVFLMTDTGEIISIHIIQKSWSMWQNWMWIIKKAKSISSLLLQRENLLPKSTKHCVAMFEDVDPKARRLDIFVTGISHFFFWRWRMINYSYKITYEREQDYWKLIEHGMTKDSSHRSYEFESKNW